MDWDDVMQEARVFLEEQAGQGGPTEIKDAAIILEVRLDAECNRETGAIEPVKASARIRMEWAGARRDLAVPVEEMQGLVAELASP